jgi:hypothetical protein
MHHPFDNLTTGMAVPHQMKLNSYLGYGNTAEMTPSALLS